MKKMFIGSAMIMCMLLSFVGCSDSQNDTGLSYNYTGDIVVNETTIIEDELFTNSEEIHVINNCETVGFMVYLYDVDDMTQPIAQNDMKESLEFTNLTSATKYKIGLSYDESVTVDISITD